MANKKTQQVQEDTNALLKKAGSGGIEASDIALLRSVLRFHENRYYILNDPLVSDFEYDTLYKQLEKLEKENPDLLVKDSPTQRVGVGLTKELGIINYELGIMNWGW